MADRFYSEGSKNNGAAGSNVNASSPRPQSSNPYSKVPTKPLGDFSENIDSNNNPKASYQQPVKKFEVHIRDFDDFEGMPEPPTAPKAPVPIPQQSAPVRRPVPPTAPKKRSEGVSANVGSVQKKAVSSKTAPAAKKAASKADSPLKKERVKTKKSKAKTKRQLSPEMQQRLKAKRKYEFIKTTLIACVCIFFISIMTVSASTIAMQFINDILVIDKQGGSVSVEIPDGSDFDDVFNIIEKEGLVKQKTLCYVLLKLRNYHTMEYIPGIYLLDKDAGVEINMEAMMLKKSGNKGTVRLTFPEGWTIAQIFEKIEKYKVCSADKLYANLDLVGKQYEFINEIEGGSDRYLEQEGYLFPDTYDFFIEENPSSVLKKLFNNFNSKWSSEYSARAKELGLSVDEVINIASIIQREAKDSSQMAVISSVIHNRLSKASTYPTLDMNSTKDYVSSLKKFNVFSDFYYELYLGTYNTYSSQGLPPGPICSPGATAIRAALYPAVTDYYFFMHSPDGKIYLARTASEHQKNTQLYLYG